jgi:hypothetical protein
LLQILTRFSLSGFPVENSVENKQDTDDSECSLRGLDQKLVTYGGIYPGKDSIQIPGVAGIMSFPRPIPSRLTRAQGASSLTAHKQIVGADKKRGLQRADGLISSKTEGTGSKHRLRRCGHLIGHAPAERRSSGDLQCCVACERGPATRCATRRATHPGKPPSRAPGDLIRGS